MNNRQAKNYHNNMAKVFAASNKVADANIKRHLNHVEELRKKEELEDEAIKEERNKTSEENSEEIKDSEEEVEVD